MCDPYEKCPEYTADMFTLRLITPADSPALFRCYHDRQATDLMNADNCDFGFYMDTPETMARSVGCWLEAYRNRDFIRFAIVDNETESAVGTMEGFGGDTGVLRVDIASACETEACLTPLIRFARTRFRELFGNNRLVTKAIPQAACRRRALEAEGWAFIDTFRTYRDYYSVPTQP